MHKNKPVGKNLFTIPAGIPFVDALATGLHYKTEESADQLADFTILLPSRRAVHSLRDAFLRISAGKPTLLPRLIPLGDLDEDEQVITGWQDSDSSFDGDLLPAISSLRRQLLLTRLVQAFENEASSADQASRLAAELGRLLDQVQTQRLSFEDLKKIVPEDYAKHWQVTLTFLEIITKEWPAILKELGCLDPADRRNKLLENQSRLWSTKPPEGYIIAAGSTGSIPATADLLNLVAGLPNGCVVLPGLDQTMDEGELATLESTHPQYQMIQLLSRMSVRVDEVREWRVPGIENLLNARANLINTALRPASSINMWRHLEAPPFQALKDVEYLECTSLDEESGVIALMMRKNLEEKGKTAALITADRELARRVKGQLHRWEIEIDDSAGQPLANVPPGIFLRLTAKLIIDQFKPIDLLAACKHPFAACGYPPAKLRELIRRLEVLALRGPRPAPGINGLTTLLENKDVELYKFLERLGVLSNDFTKLSSQNEVTLRSILKAHIAFAEDFAASNTESGTERLWKGKAGETAAMFVSELLENADTIEKLPGIHYPAFFESGLQFPQFSFSAKRD